MNFNKSLAIDTVTITDLTDAIVSIEEPTDPTNGTLWIDISTGEEEGILKQYIIRDGEDKGQWVTVKLNMEYLNPELSETVKFVNKQLTDMGDDGLLTYGERVELSKMIAEITGESPSTTTSITVGYTNSLPTPETLDSGGSGGTFFKYRYSARQVGINEGKDKGNPIYANLENAYNELNDYLSQFTPKPWDITISNKDLVVELGGTADKLREVFLNYYTAALALSELTKERGVEVSKEYTDEGIDNISIGGTNLISSEKAKEGIGLDSKGNEISNVLYDTSDFIEVVGGKDYSMSIFVTPQTENEFIKYAWYDSNRTFISSGGLTDTSKTIKAPENAKYIRVAYLKDIKPKFEVGNKPTDWSPNPDDIESQIEHTQASLTVTSNAIRGIVLETIGGSEVATIDEKTGEIVYVDTKKTRLSQIEQKADSITSTVSENTGAITKVEQTVNSISSTVSNNTSSISSIRQTVNSISSKVEGQNSAISRIEQTADGISATVASNNTGSNMVSKINLSSGGIRISGNRIAIDGDTTFSKDVKISGNLVVGGTITSSTINLVGGHINSDGKGAWLEGTQTGLHLNDKAFKFDYTQPAFEAYGRINAFPEGRGTSIKHSFEINGITIHNGSAWFKYYTSERYSDFGTSGTDLNIKASSQVTLKAPITRIDGALSIASRPGGREYTDVSIKMFSMEKEFTTVYNEINALKNRVSSLGG